MKHYSKGRHFADIVGVQQESMAPLDNISVDNVSRKDGNAGITAASHRDSTLKETKFSNL